MVVGYKKRTDMKKILAILTLFASLTLTSCGGDGANDTLAKDIVGQWHLVSWSSEMSENIDVYVEFKADSSFALFQKDWNSPIQYASYTGTYLVADGIVTGKYSDGKNWGAANGYTATVSEDGKLTLVNVDNQDDISIFAKATIPSDVTTRTAIMTTRGEESFQITRFL